MPFLNIEMVQQIEILPHIMVDYEKKTAVIRGISFVGLVQIGQMCKYFADGLEQDYGNTIVNAMVLPQSCFKASAKYWHICSGPMRWCYFNQFESQLSAI